jgi:hypothetical protein
MEDGIGGGAGGGAGLPVADAGHADSQRHGEGEQEQPEHGALEAGLAWWGLLRRDLDVRGPQRIDRQEPALEQNRPIPQRRPLSCG